MVNTTMARPKKFHEDAIQLGWRLDGKDAHILAGLQAYADAHRLSRNSAITIAVEHLLAHWEQQKTDTKKPKG